VCSVECCWCVLTGCCIQVCRQRMLNAIWRASTVIPGCSSCERARTTHSLYLSGINLPTFVIVWRLKSIECYRSMCTRHESLTEAVCECQWCHVIWLTETCHCFCVLTCLLDCATFYCKFVKCSCNCCDSIT